MDDMLMLMQPDCAQCLAGRPALPRLLYLPVEEQLRVLSRLSEVLQSSTSDVLRGVAWQAVATLAGHNMGPWSTMVQTCAAIVLSTATLPNARANKSKG